MSYIRVDCPNPSILREWEDRRYTFTLSSEPDGQLICELKVPGDWAHEWANVIRGWVATPWGNGVPLTVKQEWGTPDFSRTILGFARAMLLHVVVRIALYPPEGYSPLVKEVKEAKPGEVPEIDIWG